MENFEKCTVAMLGGPCSQHVTGNTSRLNQLQSAIIFNTLRLRQNGCHFPDDIFKYISLNENIWISIKISLEFVPKGPIKNIPALVQIMAWRQPGNKPLSESVMTSSLTHICVTRPQWVNSLWPGDAIWRHRSGSTLAQVMACCLMAPSHYLN